MTRHDALSELSDEDLVAYLDGELDSAQRQHVEQRLACDPRLRAKVRDLQASWDLLEALPRSIADPALTRTTVALAIKEAEHDASPGSVAVCARRVLAPALAVLIAGSLGFGVVYLPAKHLYRKSLSDLAVAQNIEFYRYAEDIEFLRSMRAEGILVDQTLTNDVVSPSQPGAATDRNAVQQFVMAMSPGDRVQAQQRKAQFDALTDREQQHLRDLHARLSSDEGGDLHRVLLPYCAWLATLTSGERADFLELDARQRLQKMRERRAAPTETPLEDMRAVVRWLGSFISEHEEALLKQLPEDVQRRFTRFAETRSRARHMMLTMEVNRRLDQIQLPAASPQQIQSLVSELSPEAYQRLEKVVDFSNPRLATRQIFTVAGQFVRRRQNAADNGPLIDFYGSQALPPSLRDHLDRLPPAEAQELLQQIFQWSRAEETGRRIGPDRDRMRRPELPRPGSPDTRRGRRPPAGPLESFDPLDRQRDRTRFEPQANEPETRPHPDER